MLPRWFKEYLTFHRSERNAIIVLVLLLLGLIAFNMYQRFFWKGDWQEIQLKYGPSILQFQIQTDSIVEQNETPQPWLPEKKELFKFDPNTLDSAGWVALGFSPKQSASIIKYRNAGACFKKPEDIKKLFVVDDERYQELAPFINIEAIPEKEFKREFENRPKWEKPKFEPVVVELNTADTNELIKLRGIGSSYAKRIVKYRELLGGYITKEQLLEVYGMDTARFNPISAFVTVDTTIRERINVNTADVKQLLKHPYINLNQAKAIVNYREQHGAFRSISDLENIHLLKGEPYRKIAAYITLP
ncbi:MAG: helix-hairpin-helix domain-containing protein [Flavobacteriales bacterium]|nr:helix-hairpin-helix domain-containing protein [Flavobacteriales bacterium]